MPPTSAAVGGKRRREQSTVTETLPDAKRVALTDVTNQSHASQSTAVPQAVKATAQQVPARAAAAVPPASEKLYNVHDEVIPVDDPRRSSANRITLRRSGGSTRPQRRFVDIDRDLTDPSDCVTYCNDIFRTLYRQERTITKHYMREVQDEINSTMRAILIDWLVEVTLEYQLCIDSLYLAKSIIDQVLTRQRIERGKLQLLGLASLLIATKFEEERQPSITDLVFISANSYPRNSIISMETHVLNLLEFNLTIPTQMQFLPRFLRAATCLMTDVALVRKVENLSFYLSEISLLAYELCFYKPSEVALTSLVVALAMLGLNPWCETLEHYSGHRYASKRISMCVTAVHKNHLRQRETTNLRSIYNKWATPEKDRVSLLPSVAKPIYPGSQ